MHENFKQGKLFGFLSIVMVKVAAALTLLVLDKQGGVYPASSWDYAATGRKTSCQKGEWV